MSTTSTANAANGTNATNGAGVANGTGKGKKSYGFIEKLSGGNTGLVVKSAALECLNNLSQVLGVALIYFALDNSLGNLVQGEPVNFPAMWIICLCFIPTVALYMVAQTFAYDACYLNAYRLSADGRVTLASCLKRLPLGYIKSRDPGDLSNAIMNDYSMLETTNSHTLPQLIASIVLPCVVFVMLLFFNWRMSLAMIAAIPLALLVILLSVRLQDKLSKRQTRSRINAANRLQEYLTGIKHIKSNNMSGKKFERLDKAMQDLMRDSIRMEAIAGPILGVASFITRSSMIIMTLVGSYLLIGGEIDLMVFIGFLLMSTSIYVPLTTAFGNFVELRYTATAGERILELQNTPVMSGGDDAPAHGDILFDNVTFRYRDVDVLKDVSILIPEGKVTALVGPSGSGKTTLTRIAERFWDVNAGTVSLGGKDIRECDPDNYLMRFSEVFQDTYLFEDTIAGNIGFGREGATHEEIVEAAKAAECHRFIERLPAGYNTRVGEGGATLSGGEKQRIAIARALLKDAPIIILDEATASLDATNEAAVQSAINRLVRSRTVIVIAHKLKTVRNADNIIVLDDGRVVEQGRHDDLLQQNGLYSRLYTTQQQSMDWGT
ncbi:MAG: ABC transporter ATP-binding protein/permease [Coriobacteriales bacterium]|jgi:ATP-binding cassette subfamily B protein|nr:ABC transporter ATP-binding protein/permease [Coriobacteriales bacterium]